MRKSRISLTPQVHRENPVVSLSFAKDYDLISRVKSPESNPWNVKTHGRASLHGRTSLNKDAAWSQSRRFCYIARSDFKLSEIFDKLSSVAFLDYSDLNKEFTKPEQTD